MADPLPALPGILLVDDQNEDRDALRAILAGEELELIEAATADDAVEKAARRAFAAVLIDVGAPELGGFEVAARIRAEARARALPVLFLSPPGLDRAALERGYE